MNIIQMAVVTACFLGCFALAMGFGCGVLQNTLNRTGAKRLSAIYSLFWVFVFPMFCATSITYRVNIIVMGWLS